MTTPPSDQNNPENNPGSQNNPGQSGAGGYPQYPQSPQYPQAPQYPNYPAGSGGPGYPGHPGQPGYGPAGGPPPNYLVFGILTTLLCCLPLGVISIIFATQVNTKWQQGDVAGAQKASSNAKNLAIWSALVGAVAVILTFVLTFAGVIALEDW
ncbi:MAG TPA: CD225/dispanin family protein [Actinomycetales bacterium]|nr:CD225/dispanin family protein [Actinomycetales bacterium]